MVSISSLIIAIFKGVTQQQQLYYGFQNIWQLVLQNASEMTPNLNNAILFTSFLYILRDQIFENKQDWLHLGKIN